MKNQLEKKQKVLVLKTKTREGDKANFFKSRCPFKLLVWKETHQQNQQKRTRIDRHQQDQNRLQCHQQNHQDQNRRQCHQIKGLQ